MVEDQYGDILKITVHNKNMKPTYIKKIIFGSAPIGIKKYGFQSEKNISKPHIFFQNLNNSGILDIDTAPTYGEIENDIGRFNENHVTKFRIWTKVSGLEPGSHLNVDKIIDSIKKSISKTKCNKLHCLYLHQNDISIIEDKFVQKGLKLAKDLNLTLNVGTSIYSEKELRLSLAIDNLDVIQLPISAANTYLYNIAKKNNLQNKKIIGRSILLQGTMLNINIFKKNFNFKNEILNQINLLKKISKKYDIGYLNMILAYVGSLDFLNNFILSTRNFENFLSLLENTNYTLPKALKIEIDNISNKNVEWSNPRNWTFYD